MTSTKNIVGLVLIALGLVSLLVGGFRWKEDKTVLDIRFEEVRRIQFDIERGRDATLVIVPEHINNWPRVVSVPVRHLRETSAVLARIGERINEPTEKTG